MWRVGKEAVKLNGGLRSYFTHLQGTRIQPLVCFVGPVVGVATHAMGCKAKQSSVGGGIFSFSLHMGH